MIESLTGYSTTNGTDLTTGTNQSSWAKTSDWLQGIFEDSSVLSMTARGQNLAEREFDDIVLLRVASAVDIFWYQNTAGVSIGGETFKQVPVCLDLDLGAHYREKKKKVDDYRVFGMYVQYCICRVLNTDSKCMRQFSWDAVRKGFQMTSFQLPADSRWCSMILVCTECLQCLHNLLSIPILCRKIFRIIPPHIQWERSIIHDQHSYSESSPPSTPTAMIMPW